jgi:hypothetical protein
MKISAVRGSVVERVVQFLRTAPNDEVYTSREIFETLGIDVSSGTFRRHSDELKSFVIQCSVGKYTRLYGSKKAIAAYKALHENN